MLKHLIRTRIAILVALIVIGSVGVIVRQDVRAQDNREAAVLEALTKSAASFEKNDLAMASQVWASDESLTVFESGHANY